MKTIKILASITMLIAVIVMMCGCLASEYKEYRYWLNEDGTGHGTIKFINIVSQEEDEKDVTATDFSGLIDDYLNGSSFEDENPHLTVTSKELKEENGMLMGYVTFTFDHFDSIGFYRFEDCDCAPVMYYMGSLSETFVESNGTYLGEGTDFPLLIWDHGATEFYLKTLVLEDVSDCHSLLSLWKTWKEN